MALEAKTLAEENLGVRHHMHIDCIEGEFRVCSGAVSVSEGGVRQFRGCKTTNCIGAFSESRRPGT
jgi:hypothetical protein